MMFIPQSWDHICKYIPSMTRVSISPYRILRLECARKVWERRDMNDSLSVVESKLKGGRRKKDVARASMNWETLLSWSRPLRIAVFFFDDAE